jgi:hypothetical protein
MRSAPAYRKLSLLRAVRYENDAWHTLLEAVFALIFGFWAHPRCAGSGFPLQFTSLRFVNSASIPCAASPPQARQRLRLAGVELDPRDGSLFGKEIYNSVWFNIKFL